jgi:hypothetical protein
LYVPTVDEFWGLPSETFDTVSVQVPINELGERCRL